MGTTADKLEYLQGTKAAIKEAIVNKGVAVPDGTTFRGYAEKIGDIIDVPDLSNPGAAGDLRSGKQLVGADGSVITGTLAEVEQATPTISVSSGGLITATATQSGGIVASGSKSATKQLPTQAAKTVTPGTTNQTAVASGRYTTGAVTVKGDANLKAENIAEGVSIFGVSGTFSGSGPENATVSFNSSGFTVPGASIYYVNSNQLKVLSITNIKGKLYAQKNSFLFIDSNIFGVLNGNAQLVKGGNYGSEVFTLFFVEGDFTIDVQI